MSITKKLKETAPITFKPGLFFWAIEFFLETLNKFI